MSLGECGKISSWIVHSAWLRLTPQYIVFRLVRYDDGGFSLLFKTMVAKSVQVEGIGLHDGSWTLGILRTLVMISDQLLT